MQTLYILHGTTYVNKNLFQMPRLVCQKLKHRRKLIRIKVWATFRVDFSQLNWNSLLLLIYFSWKIASFLNAIRLQRSPRSRNEQMVDSFRSDICIKITLIIKKYEQALTDIKSRRKNVTQLDEFAKRCKDSPTNMITNPVYSIAAGEHSFDLKRKLLGSETTKSILEEPQPWCSPNPAALDRPRKRSYPGSICLSLEPSDPNPVIQKDERRETNLYRSKVKRSWKI